MAHADSRTLQVEFSPASDSSGTEDVFTVPEGSAFRTERMEVYTVSDPSNNLDIGLYSGEHQIAPLNEDLAVVESDMKVNAGERLDVGDTLEVRWNTNASWTQEAVVVHVHGTDVSAGVE